VRNYTICLAAAIIAAPVPELTADPPSVSDHTHERAGGSDRIATWAKPASSCRETGGYVGGGCLRKGESRNSQTDGTWGWDYVGRAPWPQRIFLGWCHDRCRQPQPGPYRTDGPHVPDVFAAPAATSR
jgi:hypothetical protein